LPLPLNMHIRWEFTPSFGTRKEDERAMLLGLIAKSWCIFFEDLAIGKLNARVLLTGLISSWNE